jgi:ATP-binding protein involved in chromosome partitioning
MSSTTPLVITRSDPQRIEVEWSDGHKTVYSAAQLRGLCPCAVCVNEVSGTRVHDPSTVPADLEQRDARMVGNYALTMTFSDGHHTGIFTFPFLRRFDPKGA